jgi:hypothetical protein
MVLTWFSYIHFLEKSVAKNLPFIGEASEKKGRFFTILFLKKYGFAALLPKVLFWCYLFSKGRVLLHFF